MDGVVVHHDRRRPSAADATIRPRTNADRPIMADGETKFFGEPVAAVAAETLDAAEAARALIRGGL